MEINWSSLAKENLQDFFDNTKMLDNNALLYIKSLVEYVENLRDNNYLGKKLFNFSEFEIRQIIYKKHRILYTLTNKDILILTIAHTSRTLTTIVKEIQKFFK